VFSTSSYQLEVGINSSCLGKEAIIECGCFPREAQPRWWKLSVVIQISPKAVCLSALWLFCKTSSLGVELRTDETQAYSQGCTGDGSDPSPGGKLGLLKFRWMFLQWVQMQRPEDYPSVLNLGNNSAPAWTRERLQCRDLSSHWFSWQWRPKLSPLDVPRADSP
jgi:hypothetical protein